ncbi:MAG TPA: methionyl-tRNA formyltransferase [Patescibacteria group bacterium]|jgi:methionyl-tRNA formyltransferase|nr:methionyl-tRNA formyltransferase [Patescibacteria group bacterium]
MSSGKTSPQAVFFGSGPVAAASLEKLLAHTPIEAVITKPRAAHHKGAVPVLELAQQHNLTVYTVSNKRELDELMKSQSFASSYALLIDFGIIVTQFVIDQFEHGIINSHFSLLPRWRGADPISWSIASGDTKTGVSLMLVDSGLDTGKLLTHRTLQIDHDDTTPTLTDKLVNLSDELIQAIVPGYLAGDITPRNQPHPDRATYARKLTKADGQIDWHEPADVIERKIRAFAGWPQSRATIGSIDAIITRAHVVPSDFGAPGEYEIAADKSLLLIQTESGSLCINTLKPVGKKEMPVQAFLAGYQSKL